MMLIKTNRVPRPLPFEIAIQATILEYPSLYLKECVMEHYNLVKRVASACKKYPDYDPICNRVAVLNTMFLGYGSGHSWKNGVLSIYKRQAVLAILNCEVEEFSKKVAELNAIEDFKIRKEYEKFADSNFGSHEGKKFKCYHELMESNPDRYVVLNQQTLEAAAKEVIIPRGLSELSGTFSPLFKVPNKVKKDWLAGCYEIIDIIFKLNDDLEVNIVLKEKAQMVLEDLNKRFKK